MAKARIVNATRTGPPGQRGKEEKRGPVEFADRYRGPQVRIQTEGTRATAPQSQRSVAKGGVAAGSGAPAVTRSEEQKGRITSPALATLRETTPRTESTASGELRRQQQPEAQQTPQTVGPQTRPRLQETFPRGEVEKKQEQKAFAGGPGGFFIENESGTHRIGGRRAGQR